MQKIYYSDKLKVDKIIEKIKSDGYDKLHILSDFDRTITHALYKGKKTPSIISLLRANNKYLGEEYVEEAHRLFDFYHAYEIDPNLDMQVKSEKMKEWWTKHLSLLVRSGLNIKHIKECTESEHLYLRQGILSFFKTLEQKKVPVVIISANGLGCDSIKYYLENKKSLFSNIHILSNKFEYDQRGYAIGYKNHIVHVFNKSELALEQFPETEIAIQGRENIILLGDSLGDPQMSQGAQFQNILKIGFYNEQDDTNLDTYLELYDIVITGDDSGEYVNSIF